MSNMPPWPLAGASILSLASVSTFAYANFYAGWTLFHIQYAGKRTISTRAELLDALLTHQDPLRLTRRLTARNSNIFLVLGCFCVDLAVWVTQLLILGPSQATAYLALIGRVEPIDAARIANVLRPGWTPESPSSRMEIVRYVVRRQDLVDDSHGASESSSTASPVTEWVPWRLTLGDGGEASVLIDPKDMQHVILDLEPVGSEACFLRAQRTAIVVGQVSRLAPEPDSSEPRFVASAWRMPGWLLFRPLIISYTGSREAMLESLGRTWRTWMLASLTTAVGSTALLLRWWFTRPSALSMHD